MLRRCSVPVIALALAGWGCGSASDAPVSKDTAKRPAAKSGGPLKVAAVDGRVGDATAATSSDGLRQLRVRRSRTSPNVLRQGVGAGAACPDVDVMPSGDNLPVVAAATLCLVNGERADAGLPPLAGNGKLDQSSVAHSQDMVAKSYFAHESQDGRDVTDRVRSTGYIPQVGEWTVGENLAWGTGTLATPKGIVQAWMNSQGHRENILRSGFKEAGLGVALGNPRSTDGQGATYTMNFGATSGAASPTASNLTAGAQAPAPRTSTRRASARRRACRARAARARTSSARKSRMSKRCARIARRSARR